MGSTSLSKRGINPDRLSDKQKMFVFEYASNGLNGTQAAISAGYAKKSAQSKASQLLADPKIKKALGKFMQKTFESKQLDTKTIVEHLWNTVTYKASDFFDENGKLRHPNDLPEHCQCLVDGFKETTNPKTKETTLEYKITPRATARDQAMRYLGLFEKDNEQRRDIMQFNFDALCGRDDREYDPIEGKILKIESSSKQNGDE